MSEFETLEQAGGHLTAALQLSGITLGHWKEVLGSAFIFVCEHGSHHEIKTGTIVGANLSDEGGLILEVSNRTFWGKPLLGIFRSNDDGGRWCAAVPGRNVGVEFYPGALKIF